jgi:hypothetical protein
MAGDRADRAIPRPLMTTKLQRRILRSRRIADLARYVGVCLDKVFCDAARNTIPKLHIFLRRVIGAYPFLYIFLLELRSHLARIEMSFGELFWCRGVGLGWFFEPIPCNCSNARTERRILYTEKPKAIFPSATLADSRIFLRSLETEAVRTGDIDYTALHTQFPLAAPPTVGISVVG